MSTPQQGSDPGFGDFDLDASTDQAWHSFAARLADVLSVMDAGATLRIGALSADPDDSAPFVCFEGLPDGRLVARAVCSPEPEEGGRLGPEQRAQLVAQGWSGADTPDDAFSREGTQEGAASLAEATVHVLRDAYGEPHPAFLSPDQLAEILTPAPAPDAPAPVSSFDADDLRAVVPRDRAELEETIAHELRDLLGHEPVRDADGDFAIRVGSTMVFVRATEDAAEVLVFAAIVHDVEGRSRAMEVLSDLNTEARYARFLMIRDRVFVSCSVFAHPFVPAHLHQALHIVSVIGDRIDDDLATKLRGRTTFSNGADEA